MENTRLNPCPFCGGENIGVQESKGTYFPVYMVICYTCKTRTAYMDFEYCAMAVWNTRAQESAVKGG